MLHKLGASSFTGEIASDLLTRYSRYDIPPFWQLAKSRQRSLIFSLLVISSRPKGAVRHHHGSHRQSDFPLKKAVSRRGEFWLKKLSFTPGQRLSIRRNMHGKKKQEVERVLFSLPLRANCLYTQTGVMRWLPTYAKCYYVISAIMHQLPLCA